MENKRKHLEFIQNVITRMNSNSFFLKGWTITLISALFALAAKDTNINFVMISYIAIPIFWLLDGFLIAVERRYRSLYSEVASKAEDEIDFSMDASKFNKGNCTWATCIFSITLLLFYGISILTTLIVMFLIK